MEDTEQVDLPNLTFTQYMKDNGVVVFHTMACLSCLLPLYSTGLCGCLSVTRIKHILYGNINTITTFSSFLYQEAVVSNAVQESINGM